MQVARAGATAVPDASLTLSPFAFTGAPRRFLADPGAERAALRQLLEAARATGRSPGPPLLTYDRARAPGVDTLGLADLLEEDPASVSPARWSQRPAERALVTTLGTTTEGERFRLDLREAALGGHGPHGVLIGATGSGKSELLRTLLAGLVADHSPEELALVLVDFKGGATFAPLADLPHVAGVITNLADDLAMIDRMQAAIEGEMRRRQQLLHDAGDLPSVHAYNRARTRGADLPPLPALLLVVDEFSELLATRPEFIDVLGTIGRVGRSLGVHLLLASQRLEEGRLRGLDSHLRYRIGLRTFNASDSRAVLGTPEASRLPSVPGTGYVKLDEEFVRIQCAYVSAEATEDDRTELDLLVERLRDAAPKVHQVWLPPLPPAISLGELVGGLVEDPQRGLVPPHWPGIGRLTVPIGVVDRPAEQTQSVHALDLRGAAGNVAIVGAPQTGKSTALRTLLCSLELTHTPTEVQVYAIDHGGGALDALAGLQHVGAVAGRRGAELTARIVRHVQGILALRERRFAELHIDSAATLRARRAAGELPDEVFGDVILAIDGWGSLRQAEPELEPAVTDLATRGLGFGVHVILTANRWVELRPALRDGFGGAIELRLTDPIESSVNRRAAATVPIDRPGHGLSLDGHHLQVALPRIDGLRSVDIAEGVRDLVRQVAAAWRGPVAPPVKLLPEKVTFADLPAPGEDLEAGVPIGISEIDLGPLYLDLTGPDPHFLVLGDGGSGKTSVLSTFLTGLVARCTPEEARVIVIDYRRTLLEVVPDSHLLAYAGAGPAAAENAGRLRDTLLKRVPGPGVTAAQLRGRSWWSGPELYLVVDDYDLVVNPSGNPLATLTEFLAQGRDLGLHVLLARRSAGMNRAFEPFLQRLRELGSPGLLLSSDPLEGPLLGGVRGEGQPPGRGTLVRRGASPALVQTAWVPT